MVTPLTTKDYLHLLSNLRRVERRTLHIPLDVQNVIYEFLGRPLHIDYRAPAWFGPRLKDHVPDACGCNFYDCPNTAIIPCYSCERHVCATHTELTRLQLWSNRPSRMRAWTQPSLPFFAMCFHCYSPPPSPESSEYGMDSDDYY